MHNYLRYLPLMALLLLAGCNDDDNEVQPPKVNIVAVSTLPNGNSDDLTTTIDRFWIGIQQLKVREANSQKVFTTDALGGPFGLALVQQAMSSDLAVAAAVVPNGEYEGLQLQLHRNTSAGSDLNGKAVYIRGVVGGYPFVFWHGGEDIVAPAFPPTRRLLVQDKDENVQLIIPLDFLFSSMSTIDYSLLRDLNEDGLYEISPIDEDGNQLIAQQMYELLKELMYVQVE